MPPKKPKDLTSLFRKLGAPSPEAWAESQEDEGGDQLARFVFLRQAWRAVVDPTDASWIDAQIKASGERPGEPCAGAGPALERMLAAGADRADVHEVVRAMQYDLLFSLCYLLDDPGSLEPELADLSWGLFRTDDDGEPTERIESLHESVLETDPSGNEMRPSPR